AIAPRSEAAPASRRPAGRLRARNRFGCRGALPNVVTTTVAAPPTASSAATIRALRQVRDRGRASRSESIHLRDPSRLELLEPPSPSDIVFPSSFPPQSPSETAAPNSIERSICQGVFECPVAGAESLKVALVRGGPGDRSARQRSVKAADAVET